MANAKHPGASVPVEERVDCLVRWGTTLLASALAACGSVAESKDASPAADASTDPDAAPVCTPVGADVPDDMFEDSDCDGLDGDASEAVFVDPIDGHDTGDGSQTQPKAHLLGASGAFMTAASLGRQHIFVSTGVLSESATVVVPDGISVWGGYDAAQSWTRSDSIAHPLLDIADPTGVRFVGTPAPMTWDRIDVRAADATAEGASSYGVFMEATTNALVLSHSTVTAGDGATGTQSEAPDAPVTPEGADGGVGSGLIEATCCVAQLSDTCVAGPPGQNECAFAGGVGARCGAAGGAPTPGAGPMPGTAGGVREQGGPGGAGGAGDDAAVPAATFGTATIAGYTPAEGTVGTAGTAGSGGGGGGLDYQGWCSCNAFVAFPPGHGGGAGGCGGAAATAAGGGGGSFALFLFNANPTLDRVALVSSDGGNGGAGSLGGPGGAGGSGGGQPLSPVAGGNGGAGGTGGTSGGGLGGPSICLEKVGTSTPFLVTTPTCALGTGGLGGTSPNPAINGLNGLTSPERID